MDEDSDHSPDESGTDFDQLFQVEKCIDPYLRCAFYGACQTAFGFKDACVISHSPQGCQLSADVAFRWQQADYTVTEVLCSKLCEDEIVHGGEATLRRTIREAESYDVPLVFIVSACGPEIVGDNIEAVAEEMESISNFQIIPLRAPGFLGSQYKGVDIALEMLMKRFVRTDVEPVENTVCILAPHASGNPTWPGDLQWITSILAEIGVKTLSVVSHSSSLKDLNNIASCETCVVLSHDAGLNTARWLSERGIEWLCQDMLLPIGFENTGKFLRELGIRFDAEEKIEKLIEGGEHHVIENLRKRGLQVEFFSQASAAVVADSTIGVPLLRFLTEDLEMIPEAVLLRSDRGESLAKQEIKDLPINPQLAVNVEVYQVREYLKKVNPTCIVGSNIEKHLSWDLQIPLSFEIVTPVLEYRMTDKQYVGYTGMLNLIEIMQNQWWNRFKSKKRRYKSRW